MDEREIRRRIEAHPIEAPPEAMREAFEALADLDVDERGCSIERRRIGELEVDVVVPPGGPGHATLVHLHGSGYVFGSARSHRRLGIELAMASGCELWLPDYPLAPEHRWPAQRLSTAALVRAALSDEAGRERALVLGGDSAGGHLALATLLSGEPGLAAVAAVVLFSPNTLRDYSLTRTRQANADSDAMNDPERDDALAREAFGDGAEPGDPERTLVNAPLHALPPVYLDVGGDEVLLDDALVFARAAAHAGVHVELKVRPGIFHMSQLFAQHWHVADESLAEAGDWVAELLARSRGERPARASAARRSAAPIGG